MTTFPGAPRLVKGGVVLVHPETGRVLRVISLQYNPDSLSRSLQVRSVGEAGERSEVLRLKGPPVENYKLEVELDATDALERAERTALSGGIQADLCTLELLIYPSSAQLRHLRSLADQGVLEVAPMEAPLTLFVWSKQRIVPVRITELSVLEEAFDPALNPLRAKLSLGLRVLSVDDLGFRHRGSSHFLAYQRNKEQLAAQSQGVSLSALGVAGLL